MSKPESIQAAIAMKTPDEPRIKPLLDSVEVTFDLYHVSVDSIRELAGKRLTLTVEEA